MDGQPLIEQRPTDAQRFDAMAKRIAHNTDSKFGGAFVIVPPPDGGEAMEALILDTRGDALQFYMVLQAKVQLELNRLQEQATRTSGYRR